MDRLKKYLKRPTSREEWVMAAKLGLLLIAFLIVSSAAVVTLFTRASSSTLGSSVSFGPTDDASVDSSSPNKNFGDDNPVKVEKVKTALFKFNVESFTGRFITRAKLRVYIVNENKKNIIELKSATNSDWTQSTVTYKTMPPIGPTVIAMVPASSKKGWVEIDITDALRKNTGHAWTIAMTMPLGGTDSLHMTSIDSKKNKPNIVVEFSSISGAPISPYVSITPIPSNTPMAGQTISPSPSPRPGTPTVAGGAQYPSQVLNLTNWKMTLPVDAQGNLSVNGSTGSPKEVKQTALATYKLEPWYVVNPGGGVRFSAPVNGFTTSGSPNPRSELREMAHNGVDNASWGSNDGGTHTMEIDQAITHLPEVKKHIVVGQIHDSGDDVIVIRLEGSKLFVDHNGADGPILTTSYVLGTRFNVKFVVNGGKTYVYYNGELKDTLTKNYSGAYFKAGAYVQSNCKNKASDGTPLEKNCSATNYGEVVIYNVTITHNPAL